MTAKKNLTLAYQNHRKNNFKDAENLYREVLKIDPNHFEANFLLGTLLSQIKNFNEAKQLLQKAIEIQPNHSDVYYTLGIVFKELKEFQKAIDSYEKAIEIQPDHIKAYNNLGVIFKQLNEFQKAIDSYEKIIKIQPNYVYAYYNLGNAQHELGEYQKEIRAYKKAIEIQPSYEKPYINLGTVLDDLGKYDEATKVYHQAIKLKPDYARAYSNLLFNLSYKVNFDPNEYLTEAKKYRTNCQPKKKLSFQYQYEKNPKKLKIGFVSADFGNHPGGYFTLSTLRELRKKDFQLVGYSATNRKDEFSVHFKPLFSKWHLIEKKKDDEIVEQIFKDGIHILIEAQGHSAKNRLPIFMHKPAPIQASWLAQGSTGIPEIDYFVGSPHITPKEEEKYYVEKIWRLPEISQCFTPPDFDVKIDNLPATKNNFITFGCINKLAKVNDEVIALWSKVLSSVPNSKLFLKNKDLDDKKIIEDTFSRFEKQNINRNRLILGGESKTRKEVLEAYNQIDIALDPFPFQGNTSTIESVWMGVPVITLKGNRYLFHFGESINANLDMHDWIAKNHEEYISKAIKFSSDLDQLSKLRMNLRETALKSPVFDAPRFAEHFSQMLWSMWNKFNS